MSLVLEPEKAVVDRVLDVEAPRNRRSESVRG
jgi:hypothetical protein